MKNLTVSCLISFVLFGCASQRQFTKGEYEDPDQVRLMDDKFNESDAALLIEEMIASMANHPIFADSKVAPIVQVEGLRNKTSEHIDTKSLTDGLRTSLIKTGRVRFSNKEDRDLIANEVDYQNESGRVNRKTAKRRDGQFGADYVLTGDLISNVQEVGNRKRIFYKLTLNLTNLATGLIEWSDDKPIRKVYKKRSVGM